MNRQQYEQLKLKFGVAQVTKYEAWISPSDLVEFDQLARMKGNLQDAIDRYAGQFVNGVVQEVPITTKPIGAGGNKHLVKDGVTRGKGKQKALLSDPSQLVWVSTFLHETQGMTADAWEDFQDRSNDHLGENASTENDMLGAVDRRMENGRVSREVTTLNGGVALDPLNPKEVGEYAKLGGEWFVANLFPCSGRTSKFFSNAIKRNIVTTQGGSGALDTWGTEDLIKGYEQLGGTGYTQVSYKKATKSSSSKETLFVLTANSRMNPNLYGHYMNHYLTTPDNDYTIIISYDGAQILTKQHEDIVRDRKSAVQAIGKMVDARPIVGRLTIKSTRQITDGTWEDNRGFTTHYDSKANSKIATRSKANGVTKSSSTRALTN
jgi:hypothetical protein